MRLFIAITFDDDVKNDLCDAIVRLQASSLRGNFSARDNLHLTLAFIGETRDAAGVRAAMDAVTAAPFSMEISGYGVFERRSGNIHWAGVRTCPPLTELHNALAANLTARGFALDTGAFRPHLTLGREVVTDASFQADAFRRSMPRHIVTVDRMTLMKSERLHGRLVYTPLYVRML